MPFSFCSYLQPPWFKAQLHGLGLLSHPSVFLRHRNCCISLMASASPGFSGVTLLWFLYLCLLFLPLLLFFSLLGLGLFLVPMTLSTSSLASPSPWFSVFPSPRPILFSHCSPKSCLSYPDLLLDWTGLSMGAGIASLMAVSSAPRTMPGTWRGRSINIF